MAVGIQVKVSGDEVYRKALVGLSPRLNKKIQSLGLRKVAFAVSVFAKKKAIRALSKTAAVHPRKLTSRTNVGVDDIAPDFSRLPGESLVGSHLKYMAAHNAGGTIKAKKHTVAEHQRRSAFGKKTKPFTVPKHSRGPYSYFLKKRPWLQDSIDAIVPRKSEEIVAKEWERQIRGSR